MYITYNGTSADYPQPIDGELSDRELRRISEELVRSGDLPGLWLKDLPHRVFEQFVVDRIHSPKGGLRIYLRPKVPFGNGPARGPGLRRRCQARPRQPPTRCCAGLRRLRGTRREDWWEEA